MNSIRNYFLVFTFLMFSVLSYAQMQDWQWCRQAGGPAGENCKDVSTDFDGNCYLTGEFAGTAQFGGTTLVSAGGTDIFIAKISKLGLWLWAVRAGGSGDDWGTGIATDVDGNSYVTGYFNGTASFGFMNKTSIGGTDFFIAKVNTAGVWQWAQGNGTYSNDYGWDIALDGSRTSYIAGQLANDNVLVAKYDVNGSNQGIWMAADASSGRGVGICSDASGNIELTGNFTGTLVFGSYTLTSYGAADVFAARMSGMGNFTWAVHAGSSNDDYGTALKRDGLGNTYVTGYYQGNATFGSTTLISEGAYDVFVWKLDPAANTEWVSSAGGSGLDAGFSLALDMAGYILVAGCVGGSAAFGTTAVQINGVLDAFIARIDSAGNWLAAFSAGGTGVDCANIVEPDNYGNCYLAGYFYGAATFGYEGLVSTGDYDIFACRLGPLKPRTPQGLVIYKYGNTALLIWDSVTQSVFGQPLTPDYYFIYRSYANAPGSYYYLGMSFWNVFYQDYVLYAERSTSYRVTAVNVYNSQRSQQDKQAVDDYLHTQLKVGMSEEEVKQVLNSLR